VPTASLTDERIVFQELIPWFDDFTEEALERGHILPPTDSAAFQSIVQPFQEYLSAVGCLQTFNFHREVKQFQKTEYTAQTTLASAVRVICEKYFGATSFYSARSLDLIIILPEADDELKPKIRVLDPNLMTFVKEVYTKESSKEIFDKIFQAANVTLEVMYREYKSGIDPKLSVFNQSEEKRLEVITPRPKPQPKDDVEEVVISRVQFVLEDGDMSDAFEKFLRNKLPNVVDTLVCLKQAHQLRKLSATYNQSYLSISASTLVKGLEKANKLSLAKSLSEVDVELERTCATLEAALASPFDEFSKHYKGGNASSSKRRNKSPRRKVLSSSFPRGLQVNLTLPDDPRQRRRNRMKISLATNWRIPTARRHLKRTGTY